MSRRLVIGRREGELLVCLLAHAAHLSVVSALGGAWLSVLTGSGSTAATGPTTRPTTSLATTSLATTRSLLLGSAPGGALSLDPDLQRNQILARLAPSQLGRVARCSKDLAALVAGAPRAPPKDAAKFGAGASIGAAAGGQGVAAAQGVVVETGDTTNPAPTPPAAGRLATLREAARRARGGARGGAFSPFLSRPLYENAAFPGEKPTGLGLAKGSLRISAAIAWQLKRQSSEGIDRAARKPALDMIGVSELPLNPDARVGLAAVDENTSHVEIVGSRRGRQDVHRLTVAAWDADGMLLYTQGCLGKSRGSVEDSALEDREGGRDPACSHGFTSEREISHGTSENTTVCWHVPTQNVPTLPPRAHAPGPGRYLPAIKDAHEAGGSALVGGALVGPKVVGLSCDWWAGGRPLDLYRLRVSLPDGFDELRSVVLGRLDELKSLEEAEKRAAEEALACFQTCLWKLACGEGSACDAGAGKTPETAPALRESSGGGKRNTQIIPEIKSPFEIEVSERMFARALEESGRHRALAPLAPPHTPHYALDNRILWELWRSLAGFKSVEPAAVLVGGVMQHRCTAIVGAPDVCHGEGPPGTYTLTIL